LRKPYNPKIFNTLKGDTMKKNLSENKLIILDTDAIRLKKLLEDKASGGHQYCSALKEEINKAQIVSKADMPEDVVIMNSTIEILDMEDNESIRYVLVYPWESDVDSCKISILAPIGTAIIGYRQGDEILWKVPGGTRKLKLTTVIQPQLNDQ